MNDLVVALLRLLPPETAHRITLELASRFGPFLPRAPKDDPRLAVDAFGLHFDNPVGLAAGFDKNARAFRAMLRMGFAFVECGTVTPRPQPGNPRPRLYRLREDRAVINRMGFDNDGMACVAERLARGHRGVLGINIGANKDSADRIADYRTAFAKLSPFADYVTVNVSSPNTPGLRGLQNRDELRSLLAALIDARAGKNVPLLLKIAPDLDEHAMDDIADVVLQAGIEGLVVSNTTLARPPWLKSRFVQETGGLSGKPLFASSTLVLAEMRRRVGAKLVLVGVGGIASGADAYAKIRAGASLVQLYTALVYGGTDLLLRVKRELLECLTRDGFASVADAVGADARS
ncbi:MAG: quinone-dependent dihydroorotate dehydrogenase [Alphaproteobacteria bacterium]|nr:quinone-dependent dihydroorotate dehydrogenase [Alphaproteobacteria bacterium]MDE2493485.1 quinone-dependent dihydroorotate dehydrogenase [Alphaproteobacteria bacterium]